LSAPVARRPGAIQAFLVKREDTSLQNNIGRVRVADYEKSRYVNSITITAKRVMMESRSLFNFTGLTN